MAHVVVINHVARGPLPGYPNMWVFFFQFLYVYSVVCIYSGHRYSGLSDILDILSGTESFPYILV